MIELRKFGRDYVRLLPAGLLLSFACRAAYALTVPTGSTDPITATANLAGKGMLLGAGTLGIISTYRGVQAASGHGHHTVGNVLGTFLFGAAMALGGGYLLGYMGGS